MGSVRRGVVLLLVGGLVAACGARQGSPIGPATPTASPTTASRSTEASDKSDRPGLRSQTHLPAAMDTRRGEVIALQDNSPAAATFTTWAFDVRTNRWSRIDAAGAPSGDAYQVAYDVAADLVLAFPGWDGPVWAFSRALNSWSTAPSIAAGPDGVTDVVYDPDRRLVWAWNDRDGQLWSYDVRSWSWREVEQRQAALWPLWQNPSRTWYTLLTYDTVRRAVVLSLLPFPERQGQTWLYDPESDAWLRADAVPPYLLLNYMEMGTEAVYDPAHQRSLAFSFGRAMTYDSASDRWTVPAPDLWSGLEVFSDPVVGLDPRLGKETSGPLTRYGHSLVFDPVNERVILLGGVSRLLDPDVPLEGQRVWWAFGDVWAYDIDANQWTQLLPAVAQPVWTG